MGSQTLQHFELHVLLAMIRMGGETYSVPLVLALEKRMERAVSQAAVFIALQRLEKKSLVASRIDDGDRGRVRRYFAVTPAGRRAARAHHAEHARLWHGLGRLMRSRKS